MRFADYGKRVVFAAFDGGEITSDASVLLLRERSPGSERACWLNTPDIRTHGVAQVLHRITGIVENAVC